MMMTIRRSRYTGLGRWSSIHDGLVRSLARSVDFNFGQVTSVVGEPDNDDGGGGGVGCDERRRRRLWR